MRVYFLRFLSIKITKKVKEKIFDAYFVGQDYRVFEREAALVSIME